MTAAVADHLPLVPHSRDDMAMDAPPRPIIEGPRSLPWPNGWFALCYSDELRRGNVRIVPFMGSELVVYRTAAGIAHAVSPYCPHLGAHLGHGGKVEGETLVCPFHGLAYGTDGACVHSPFGRPPCVVLEQWLVQERSGMVMVWRDHMGRTPDWEIPDVDTTGFSPGRGSCQEMGGYAHDLVENSADMKHFAYLHGFTDVAMRHEADRHCLRFILTGCWHGVPLRISMTGHGLGYVLGETDVPRFGVRAITRTFATPTAPLKWMLRWTDVVRVSRLDALPLPLRSALYAVLIVPAHRWFVRVASADFPIWSNRRYLDQPRLMAGENNMAVLRRWMMQFYPDQPVR